MMPEQHAAADLSVAYVQAVAAAARVQADFSARHDYGVDGTFHKIAVRGSRHVTSGFPLDFQLKASRNWSETAGFVKFNLEAKAYNDMVQRNGESGAVSLILILLCLPDSTAQWLQISPEQMILKRCCFWERLVGTPTANRTTKAIDIPNSQLLKPEALINLLERSQKGEF